MSSPGSSCRSRAERGTDHHAAGLQRGRLVDALDHAVGGRAPVAGGQLDVAVVGVLQRGGLHALDSRDSRNAAERVHRRGRQLVVDAVGVVRVERRHVHPSSGRILGQLPGGVAERRDDAAECGCDSDRGRHRRGGRSGPAPVVHEVGDGHTRGPRAEPPEPTQTADQPRGDAHRQAERAEEDQDDADGPGCRLPPLERAVALPEPAEHEAYREHAGDHEGTGRDPTIADGKLRAPRQLGGNVDARRARRAGPSAARTALPMPIRTATTASETGTCTREMQT